ncbi:MAG: hypothetical protein Hals2KO_34630 [Halioglobus sp.]
MSALALQSPVRAAICSFGAESGAACSLAMAAVGDVMAGESSRGWKLYQNILIYFVIFRTAAAGTGFAADLACRTVPGRVRFGV